MVRLEVAGVMLALLPEGAAVVEAEAALLVADAHLGKAATFRGLGVPVPSGTTRQTLQRLDTALARAGAQRLVLLGDFLHSPHAYNRQTLAALAAWRERHALLPITLLRGNHDRRAGDPPRALGIEVCDAPLPCAGGALWLAHEPEADPRGYVLAGHVHPCVAVGARGGFDRVRLPCFHFGSRVGLLPAFGAFTGGHMLRRVEGDRVFAVGDGVVHEVPATTLPARVTTRPPR